MPDRTVDNECAVCGHKWTDRPGQLAEHYNGCPSCGSLYWKSKETPNG